MRADDGLSQLPTPGEPRAEPHAQGWEGSTLTPGVGLAFGFDRLDAFMERLGQSGDLACWVQEGWGVPWKRASEGPWEQEDKAFWTPTLGQNAVFYIFLGLNTR